ncbi:MAG: nucleotidyltransferase domain-containing protein [Candidatus Pacebacteria bacterium]|nr:nucleotidyltransferase domain-containing protein [Candidatus Paceibacterota bacterium]
MQRERLCDVLRRSEDVACAYLFGSAAQERMSPLSDVDIGVLLKESGTSDDVLVALESELSRCLPGRSVDLVSLTQAPCHLAYRIIRDGRLLVNMDPAAKESFEVRAITGYLDFKPMRDMLFKGTRRAIQRTT